MNTEIEFRIALIEKAIKGMEDELIEANKRENAFIGLGMLSGSVQAFLRFIKDDLNNIKKIIKNEGM